MKPYRILFGFILISISAFLLGQTAPSCTVTPDMIIPQGDASGLDADMVDGLNAEEIASPFEKTFLSWVELEIPGTGNSSDSITLPLLTVPPEKTLVLTDIRRSTCRFCIGTRVFVSVLADSMIKYREPFSDNQDTTLSSGIAIQGGSDVSIMLQWYENYSPNAPIMDLFVAGYLIDTAS